MVLKKLSQQHVTNLEKWKTLAVGLKKKGDYGSSKRGHYKSRGKKNGETHYIDIGILHYFWLSRILLLEVIEKILHQKTGNFIELVKMMAKYDPVLRSEHGSKLQEVAGESQRVPSYLSKGIQNEFVSILSHHVKQKIIDDINKSKYFGIMFDSTPDESHTDQMSEIIRYVYKKKGAVEVRELFLGFFSMSGKTASDMTNDILKQLEEDGLDIQLCRAQGYDNAASMSGVLGGV